MRAPMIVWQPDADVAVEELHDVFARDDYRPARVPTLGAARHRRQLGNCRAHYLFALVVWCMDDAHPAAHGA